VPVAVLARACGLGVRAFTAQCRAATGLPPAKALLRHRCELAVRLLHDGHSVAATAEQLGFASQFHFSRAFKRHLGESPSRLR
jgi:AraC-like DNA-binding protein